MTHPDPICPIHNTPMEKVVTPQPTLALVYKWVCKDCEDAKASVKKLEASDSLWLRTYAGQAMQGMCANSTIPKWNKCDDICNAAVRYAQALLAEVKKCEAENEN